MYAQCFNPSCGAALHSFSEGRLFQFEVVSISVAASDDMTQAFDEKPERQTSHFWLCGHCAETVTLILEPRRGLQVVPLGADPTSLGEIEGLRSLQDGQAESHNC